MLRLKLAASSPLRLSHDLFALLFCHFAILFWKNRWIKKHQEHLVYATLSKVANTLTNVTLIMEMKQSPATISFVADPNVFVFNIVNSLAY